MKPTLLTSTILVAMSFSISSFAQSPTPTPTPSPETQSQTWLRLTDGSFRTFSALGKESWVYEHPSILPAATHSGSNYLLFKVGAAFKVGVVDAAGRLYIYDGAKEAELTGGVFYIAKDTQEIVAIDATGSYMPTTVRAHRPTLVGGNYFFDSAGTLHTIKANGVAPWNWAGMITAKSGVKLPQPQKLGGLFYVTEGSQIITIASNTGFYSNPKLLPEGETVQTVGGNFLVTNRLNLYSVDAAGELKYVKKLTHQPLFFGYSYLVLSDQQWLTILADGSAQLQMRYVAVDGKSSIRNHYPLNQIQAHAPVSYRGAR